MIQAQAKKNEHVWVTSCARSTHRNLADSLKDSTLNNQHNLSFWVQTGERSTHSDSHRQYLSVLSGVTERLEMTVK